MQNHEDRAVRWAVATELHHMAQVIRTGGFRGDVAARLLMNRGDDVVSGATLRAPLPTQQPTPGPLELPVWTGTSASAQQIGDILTGIDKYASVSTDDDGLGNRVMLVDTVQAEFRLNPGDQLVYSTATQVRTREWAVARSGS